MPVAIERIFGRLASGRTIRAGVWLFAVGTVGAACSYVFHFSMGRLLGPGDYAALVSLMALAGLILTPCRVSQLIVADSVARLNRQGDSGMLGWLLVRAIGLAAVAALMFSVIVGLTWAWWISFLHLDSPGPLVAWTAWLCLSIVLQPCVGFINGRQQFVAQGLVTFLSDTGQLFGGLILVGLGWGLSGAVGAFVVALLLAGLAVSVFLANQLRMAPIKPVNLPAASILGYAGQVLAGAAALTFLVNIDTVLARHYLPAQQAGLYGAVATLGNAVYFLPAPFLSIVFPKTSQHHAAGRPGGRILRRALLVTGLFCAGTTAVYALVPGAVLGVLYGDTYLAAAGWLWPYGLAMAGFSLVAVLRTYFQARHEWLFIGLMAAAAAAQVTALAWLGLGPAGYIGVLLCSAWGLLGTAVLIWIGSRAVSGFQRSRA